MPFDKNGIELNVGDWVYYTDTFLYCGFGVIVDFTIYNESAAAPVAWVNLLVGSGAPDLLTNNNGEHVGFFDFVLEKLPSLEQDRNQILVLKKLEL